MTRRALALAFTLVLLLGATGAPGWYAGTASAASGSVTLDKALSGQTRQATLTFSVRATGNGTVSVPSDPSSGDSNVAFSFSGWRDTTAGGSGGSSSWTAVSGHTYRITYVADVSTGASGGSDGTVDTTVSISGPADRSSERLSVGVDYVEPDVGSLGNPGTTATFEGGSEASTVATVDIPNNGRGALKPTEFDIGSTPAGIHAETDSLPNVVDGGDTGTGSVSVTVDESVAEGRYSFDATLVDNLDSTSNPSFTVTVDVEKPPAVGVKTIDVGDVLVGDSKTKTFTVHERNGYSGLDGVSADVRGSEPRADVGFSGLGYVSTSPGGSDTADVTVSVDGDAEQHEKLNWNVRVVPSASNGIDDSTTVTGRVIYPAYFGGLSMPRTTITFDEPRDQTDTFTERVEVDVENGGDLPMDVTSVDASAQSSLVEANVVDAPGTIDGLSSGTVTVELVADSAAPELASSLTVAVDAADAGSKSVTRSVDIVHEVSLGIDSETLAYGDLVVTKTATKSTDVAEELGYKDVRNLTIRRVSGPDRWLSVVERPPETLDKGDSAPFVVETRFTPDAKLFKQYTWTFRVTGDNVDTRTITVTARAKPISFESVRKPLLDYRGGNGWQSAVAGGMVESLNGLEQKLRENENVSRQDLPSVVAASRASTLFIDSASTAQDRIAAGEDRNATDAVVRAAAAYKLMSVYVPRIEDPQLKGDAERARRAAGERLDALIERQTGYYREQLSGDDVSAIERAAINRQLSRIAALEGDTERADALREKSRTAFDRYLGLVRKGSEKRVEASRVRQRLEGRVVTTVAGQTLLLNPAAWDTFTAKRDRVLSLYDESAATFAEAGATEKARETRARRAAAAADFQTAKYSLFVASGVYLLGFLGAIGYVGRQMYAYIQDARAAVTGDFLL